MSSTPPLKPNVGYIAYIDESGDFGLRYIAPHDPQGASEWLILSGVVIRASNEAEIPKWLSEMRYRAKNTQSFDLHFRTLNDRQKTIICEDIAKCNVRLFVVISNKLNMRQFKNDLAAKISNTRAWFYWWMCRLLLERITEFCEHRNDISNTPGLKLRIELSRRKDLRYWELSNYLARLWAQSENGTLYLGKRVPKWSVLDHNDIHAFDHRTRAGLQFADAVANSFFQAVNREKGATCNPVFAELLKPRVWRGRTDQWFDEGFKVFPFPLRVSRLDEGQKAVFRSYGYPESKW